MPPAAAQVSGLAMVSQHGDWVGSAHGFDLANTSYLYRSDTATFSVEATYQHGFKVTIWEGNDWWVLEFAGAYNSRLQAGTYLNAERAAFHAASAPGMEVYGEGRGSNRLLGSFTISEITYDNAGVPTSLHLLFEQHSEIGPTALFGELWYNASTPLLPSRMGYTTARTDGSLAWQIPAGLRVSNYQCSDLPAGLACDSATGVISGQPQQAGQFFVPYRVDTPEGPAAGTLVLRIAAPDDVTSLVVRATPDGGRTYRNYRYSMSDGYLLASSGNNFPGSGTIGYQPGLDFRAWNLPGLFVDMNGRFRDNDFWIVNFATPGGLQLQIGDYPNAVSSSYWQPGQPGLFFIGIVGTHSDGMNERLAFQINEFELGPSQTVARFSANFSTTTASGAPAVSGEIRYNARLKIASPKVAGGTINQPLDYQITANNSPTSFSASALPAGLTLDAATGRISGIPTASGYTPVVVSASGTGGIASTAVSFEVAPLPPLITSPERVDVVANQPLKFTLTSLNGPVSFTVGNVSPFTFDAATATISGVCPGEATLYVPVSADNGHGTASQVLTVNVNSQPYIVSNVSTRARVQTDDNVVIGGFIIDGNKPKRVIVRAVGPSLLNHDPSLNILTDPTLELYNAQRTRIAFNDNWQDSQRAEIQATQLAPSDPRESSIVATLSPGAFTAIVRGKNAATGVALVEVYDLDKNASRLVNLSTRGRVEGAGNVMIGGFIVGHISGAKVLIRAVAPSLSGHGLPSEKLLQDPVLELYDPYGNLMAVNDNWNDADEERILNTGLAPSDKREAAILTFLESGNYTAIVRGKNGATGIALVEIYWLDPTK